MKDLDNEKHSETNIVTFVTIIK